jgi:SagB-type dehydrogenase family enzyme
MGLAYLGLAGCTVPPLLVPGKGTAPARKALGPVVPLPEPRIDGPMPLEQALAARRSIREYGADSLSLAELGQLLWAAQGITDGRGFRTAPSAGATYPLQVLVCAGNVTGLAGGVYRYRLDSHDLLPVQAGDYRAELAGAALDQSWMSSAPAVLALAAIYERTTARYGERGIRYVHMEVGHAAQNVYLQAMALGLGTVFVGAFHDDRVKAVLALDDQEVPLGLMPVGRRLGS